MLIAHDDARRVTPLYYDDRARWRTMMKEAIGTIAYHFNSQRMMRRHAREAYLRWSVMGGVLPSIHLLDRTRKSTGGQDAPWRDRL